MKLPKMKILTKESISLIIFFVTTSLFLSVFLFPIKTLAFQDLNEDGIPDSDQINLKEDGVEKMDTSVTTSNLKMLVDRSHDEDFDVSGFTKNLKSKGWIVDELIQGPVTLSKLEDYHIFLVPVKIRGGGLPFQSNEISALKNYIERGGGTWVFEEYVDDWKSSSITANSISQEFGVIFNQDEIYDSTNNAGRRFWPFIHEIKSHPITQGVTGFGYYAGCSLDVEPPAKIIATGDNDTHSLYYDSYPSVLATVEYGLGRAVFYGDCTPLHPSYYPSQLMDSNKLLLENIVNWLAPPNQPPTFSNLNQYKSDGETIIEEGKKTTESTIVFKAMVSDPDNDQVKLQIELREFDEPFTGVNDGGILSSDFVDPRSKTTIIKQDLINGRYHWRARVIDKKGAVSDWKEFGEIDNVDFEVKLVPLYTQVYSPYPSETETWIWSRRMYGAGNYRCKNPRTGISDISSCGCAITSMVMLSRYYDINTAIDGSNVDSGNINTWLTNNEGYTSDGGLWWDKAVEYLGFIDETTGKRMVRLKFNPYTDYNVPFTNPRIDNYVNSAKPIMAYSKKFGHYFIVHSKLNTTYKIKDPYWYNTETLNDNKNLANKVQDYNNHFNKANLFSYIETPKPITASIYLRLTSPAELLVTDPKGRKLGKDPISNTPYNEIPDSNYTREGSIVTSDTPLDPEQIQESKIISIPSPIDGEYNIQVIGTDSGSYTTGILAYDKNGQSKDIIEKGVTRANNIQEFELNYSSQTIQEIEFHRIVNIDIKPGSYPNSINLKSKGVIPVAVLTNEFFDAKDVVIDNVVFAGANPKKGNLEDIDNDNDMDLILHFRTQSLQLTSDDTETILIGQLKDNSLIEGIDSIRIIQRNVKQTILEKLFSYINQLVQRFISAIGLALRQ